MPFRICRDRQSLDRARAVDLHRQPVLFGLHHAAHHGAGRQKTAQSRSGDRAQHMRHSCKFNRFPGVRREETDLSFRRRTADHIIIHFRLLEKSPGKSFPGRHMYRPGLHSAENVDRVFERRNVMLQKLRREDRITDDAVRVFRNLIHQGDELIGFHAFRPH